MSRTALLTTDAEFERKLRAAAPDLAANGLARVKGEFLRMEAAAVADTLAKAGAEVVCIGPGVDVGTMLSLARAFDSDHPEVMVLLVADPSPELSQWAMRAGVRDLLPPDAPPGDLLHAFERARHSGARRHATATAPPRDDPRAPAPAKVVTVLSAKGGSGKTMVSSNLAVALAGGDQEVAIVDLDVHFGDVATVLQLKPAHTLADVAASPPPLDRTVLKIFLVRHASGLYALCAPPTPAAGDELTSETVVQALDLLAEEFGVVVVDTAGGLDELALAAIERSTDLVLLCTPDVVSVKCLRKELDAIDQLGFTGARRHFVLNRSDARTGLEVADIESVVGMTATVSIPGSRAVPTAMNMGSTVLDHEPRSDVARELRRLAEAFGAAPVKHDPLARFQARLKRRAG
ncbi:MAG: AAA family ATPase [Acidimicrobiales bacterium]